ncbi:MAG: DNA-protecting protein DprA, partial [Deferribacteraceae bacterium]|nr:DNA-protecting protein DprA [Deferribacteraceae bacterium]
MNSDDIALAALSATDVSAAEVGALLKDNRTLTDIIYSPFSKVNDAVMKAAEANLRRVEAGGAEIISILTPDYPSILKEINDPPLLIFLKGEKRCLEQFCIGIVGSRKASRNGLNIASEIAGSLARCGITVVSGFAFGVDIAAHLSAAATGSTAVVLGSGFENIYPKEHIKYLDKICVQGCVLTEFYPQEKPVPYNFPKRNRIISGLSKGVIICEASARSGSLITA